MRSLLLSLSLLALVAGCQNPGQIAHTGANASAGLAVNLDSARQQVASAIPHSDVTGKAILQVADQNLVAAKAKLIAIDAAIAQVGPLQTKVDKLEHQFWSPRQIGLAWVVGGSTAALLVTLICCYLLTPFGPVIGQIAYYAFHVLTAGLVHLFGTLSNSLAARLQKALAGTRIAPIVITSSPTK